MRILNEISDLGPRTDGINSLRLDDPELFKYPLAYIIEVGWWEMSDSEAEGLREYLQKGGFLIVDDFKVRRVRRRHSRQAAGWDTFEQNMQAGAARRAGSSNLAVRIRSFTRSSS